MTVHEEQVVANPNWRKERRREVRLRRSELSHDFTAGAATYKIAISQAELEESFHLVWQSYVDAGLQPADSDPIRFTKYHLAPDTKVFVAKYHPELREQAPDYSKLEEPGRIVGTLTMVPDSPMGLPLEEVCGPQIDELREEGGRLVEIIALAVDPAFRNRNLMMQLYKMMVDYVCLEGYTDITCSVTKRHIRFYQSLLLFEPVGDLYPYSAANGMEVQCHRINIERGRQVAKEVYHDRHFDADLYTFFFTDNPEVNRPAGKGEPWDESMLRYFLSERTRFIDKLDEPTLAILRQLYAERGRYFPF